MFTQFVNVDGAKTAGKLNPISQGFSTGETKDCDRAYIDNHMTLLTFDKMRYYRLPIDWLLKHYSSPDPDCVYT